MAAAIRTEVEHRAVSRWSPPGWTLADRPRLARLLLVDPASRRSEFDRLKTPAQGGVAGEVQGAPGRTCRRSTSSAPTEQWLGGHPAGEDRALRRRGPGDRRRRPAQGIGEAKRLTLLASLIHDRRTAARDEVATMFCKRMAAIHKKGREHLEELREAHRAESERLLGVFGDVLAGVREATGTGRGRSGRGRGRRLWWPSERRAAGAQDAGRRGRGGARCRPRTRRSSAHHGNNYLPLLERYYRSPPLGAVHPARHPGAGADQRGPQRAGRGGVPARDPRPHRRVRPGDGDRRARGRTRSTMAIDIDFVTEAWRKILCVKDRPGKLVRRHLEVCVFSYLASELRSGDIAVVGAGLLRQPARPADVLGRMRAAGRAVLRPGRDPARTRRSSRRTTGRELADSRRGGGRRVPAQHRPGPSRRAARCCAAARAPTGGRPRWRWRRRSTQRLPERGLLDILARTALPGGVAPGTSGRRRGRTRRSATRWPATC